MDDTDVTFPRVAGYCPACNRDTLYLAAGGHVTCSSDDCTAPEAADALLGDGETAHMVHFREDGFTVTHPLRERVAGTMHTCKVHGDLAALPGPPVGPGDYRVSLDGDGMKVVTPGGSYGFTEV